MLVKSVTILLGLLAAVISFLVSSFSISMVVSSRGLFLQHRNKTNVLFSYC